jgi:hypothetical protein
MEEIMSFQSFFQGIIDELSGKKTQKDLEDLFKSVKQPGSIIQYCEILSKHLVGSSQAEMFKKQYLADPVFMRRAKVAEELFKHKDSILAVLDKADREEAKRCG